MKKCVLKEGRIGASELLFCNFFGILERAWTSVNYPLKNWFYPKSKPDYLAIGPGLIAWFPRKKPIKSYL